MDIDALIREKFKVENGNSPPFKCVGVTREMLAQFMGELGFKTGAEIGVFRGAYSCRLCLAMPGLKIKCIDPWLPFRKNSRGRQEERFAVTSRRLKQFNAEIIRKTSMEAVKEVPDKSLDFVYIDAMHEFDPVMLDIICWSDKVRPGGIVAGHDYSPPKWYNGVMLAVNTYVQAHEISKWYVTDDEDPSFFWVK
jgi:predicted O-methyltransferase YrrM